jgi:hypothetical protein
VAPVVLKPNKAAMARKPLIGECRLCGAVTELSFEHVPPRSAFNDRPIVDPDVKKLIESHDISILDRLSGKTQQRGAGGYTLCTSCNNQTGKWYGPAYAGWAYQGYDILSQARGEPTLLYPFHLFPLRVFKQIVCMFFSANGPGFRAANQELVRFVLNRDHKYIDPKIRIFAYYTNSGRSRQAGITGMLELDELNMGVARSHVFSEISFPPFGYILAANSPPPDRRLVDISFFAQFGYNDWVDISLRLPVLPIYSWLPGDFRSRNEVLTAAAQAPRQL